MSASQARGVAASPKRAFVHSAVRYIPLLALAAILVVLIVQNPRVIEIGNLESIAVAAVPSALTAIGLALVIAVAGDDVMSGGIDLSLPNQAVFSAAVIALSLLHGAPLIVALGAGVGVALLTGILNAVLIVRLGMMPMLATLATSVFVGGVTRAVTTNRRLEVTDPVIISLRDNDLLGVPIIIWITLVITVACSLVFHHTRFGLRVQAVGGNREFAARSGVRPAIIITLVFLAASLLAGLASTSLLARASGWSTGSEDQLLLDTLLAGYLAPVFTRKSIYTPAGAVLGALLTSALSNALVLGGVDNSLIDGAKGILILLVVGASALGKKD